MKKEIKKGLSVIIPTFNRAKYLYSTLLCLTSQKVEKTLEYEIVVIDSGVDETEIMVHSFQNTGKVSIIYKRIKRCKNRSLLRNVGAELSNYSILCFLDNDMLVPPDFIQRHYDEHVKKSHMVIMGARRFLVEFNIFEFGEEKLLTDFNSIEKLAWYGDDRIYENISIQPWRYVFSHTLSIERNDFENAGKFNNGFGNHWGFEDVELGIRLQKNKCDFKLIKDSFTYHQPHFQQSNIEQHEKNYNEFLFMQTHNYYETELYKSFYINFDEYYLQLKKLEKEFIYPDKKSIKKYDVILGALISLDANLSANPKIHLGTYCIEETNSKDKVLILKDFFKYPEIIKISILFEAFRISPKVCFENISSTQEDEIVNLSLAAGIVVRIDKQKDVSIFIRDWDQDSKLFLFLIPDILQPEKRFVYLWLANWLLVTNHYVKIRDMKNTTVFDKEDFNFGKEERTRIENNINRYFGKNRLQFIGSSSMLMTDMQIEFPKTNSSYIFFDDDYELKYDSLKKRHIGMCTCYDESVYSILSAMCVHDYVQKCDVTPSTFKRNSFCCFMENGFFEDGIDIILEALKDYKLNNKDFSLIIKLPNYDEIKKEIFPLHNETSKQAKCFASTNKFEYDFQLLLKTIEKADLKENITVIKENYNIKKIIELINNTECLINSSRGCCGAPEVYASIFLRKRTIIPSQLKIPDIFKQFCISVKSTEIPFAEELHVPISCINSNYLAFRIDEKELYTSLQKNCAYITENIEEKIIQKGNKFLYDLFGE